MSIATAGALLAGVMVGSGFAQGGDERLPGPGADALAEPVIQEQIAAERQAAEEAEQRRQQPDEIAARQRSRTEYQDLTSDEARRLALESFPDLLAAPATAPLELPPGAEVERYYGTHAALIDPPGAEVDTTSAEPGAPPSEPGGVLQSTMALRAETEHGDLRPIDPELTDRGAYLEPANATVEAELPDDLAQGIVLPELDLALAPEGAAAASSAAPASEDAVFYGELGGLEDTDFLAAATPTGAEAIWQLRSAESPERLALDIELPADARLESAFEGLGARVVRDGQTSAIVTPPIAFDADGRSVPVSMAVSESGLELAIEHRSGDWKYPLLVDPVIEYWFWANFHPDVTGWDWEDSCADPCNRFYQGGNHAISSQSFSNTFYWQSEYAQWFFRAPPKTYVEQAEFWWQDHNHSEGDSACTVQGIYGNGWELGYAWVDPGGWAEPYPGTPYVRCHPYSVNVVSQGVGRHLGDNGGSDPIGTDRNAAIFQLFFDYSKTRIGAYNFMRQANIHLFDRYDPAFTTPRPASQGWRDDSLPGAGTQTYSRTIGVSDEGLGVKHIDLWVPNEQGVETQHRETHPCTGAPYAAAPNGPCPGNWQHTFHYTLPEGNNLLSTRGWDLGWRYTGRNPDYWHSWQQPIDRSAPQIDLMGSLKDAGGEPVADGTYSLTITATDGNVSSPAAERSGVKQLEVRLDGQVQTGASYGPAPCPAGNCQAQRTLTINTAGLSEGAHTITIKATDQLGHQANASLPVDVDHGNIFNAEQYTGNPSNGGALLSEVWRQRTGVRARLETSDGTKAFIRNNCTISSQAAPCDTFTARMPIESGTPDAYANYESIRAHDPNLPNVGRDLDPEFATRGTLTATGPLSQVAADWQGLPTGHSAQYERYDRVGGVGEEPIQMISWVDAATDLPIRVRYSTLNGSATRTVFWSYARLVENGELPSGFFRLPAPPPGGMSERVERVGPEGLGPQTDMETGGSFKPYFLGALVDLGSRGRFCLVATDRVRMRYPQGPTNPDADPDPEFPGDDQVAADTFTAANYTRLQAGQACHARTLSDDTPDLSLISMQADSTDAQGWTRAYRQIGDAVDANPGNEDRPFSGRATMQIGGQATVGTVVRVDRISADATSSLFKADEETLIMIDAPIPKATVPQLGPMVQEAQ